MKKFACLAFVGTVVLTSACAHAAPPLTDMCPAGTQTASVAQKSLLTPESPLESPPIEGAYANEDIQAWAVNSGGNGQPFFWTCNPNKEGFANVKKVDIPSNVTLCKFDTQTGIASCSP